MRKIIIKYFAIAIAIEIALCSLISCSLNAKAEVPANQKVVGHSGTWTGYTFNFIGTGKYFTLNDTTNVPTSTYLYPTYFYTKDSVTFKEIPFSGLNVFMRVANDIAGFIVAPDSINNVFQDYLTKTNKTDSANNKYIQNCIYDSNDKFIGIALNDISGCYYEGNNDTSVEIPDDYSDNVYNFTQNYLETNSNIDYFTWYPFSNDTILNNYYDTSFMSTSKRQYIEGVLQNVDICYYDIYRSGGKHEFYNGYLSAFVNPVNYFVSTSDSIWNMFIEKGKVEEDRILLATDFVENLGISPTPTSLQIIAYSFDDEPIQEKLTYNLNTETASTNTISSISMFWLDATRLQLPFNKSVTFYKSLSVKQGLDNKTYTPDNFTTDKYNNYDVNQDNSTTVTFNSIGNSIQYNDSIYNDASDSYYEYYDNGYYDSSTQTTNITNITNNYYSGQNDPDDPDDPDNPDNPDNPDDPENPSGTLEAILEAILRFFNAIGDIIGTVLAGLLNMIDEVLESIAGITENMTGLTDFFSAMLGWLPDPIPQILGIGISICIICAIVKFIRG